GPQESVVVRKRQRRPRPDDLTRKDRPVGKAAAQEIGRPRPECGIGAEDIDQHRRVDRGDHGLPGRRRAMMRSVFSLPAAPNTALTGSSTASFTATSLLPSVSKRNLLPGSMPRALRIGPGIVT